MTCGKTRPEKTATLRVTSSTKSSLSDPKVRIIGLVLRTGTEGPVELRLIRPASSPGAPSTTNHLDAIGSLSQYTCAAAESIWGDEVFDGRDVAVAVGPTRWSTASAHPLSEGAGGPIEAHTELDSDRGAGIEAAACCSDHL